jgi:hypothetical protein
VPFNRKGESQAPVIIVLAIISVAVAILAFTAVITFWGNTLEGNNNSTGLSLDSYLVTGNSNLSSITIYLNDSGNAIFVLNQVNVSGVAYSRDAASFSIPLNPGLWALVVNGTNTSQLERGNIGVLLINSSGLIDPAQTNTIKMIFLNGTVLSVNVSKTG